MHRTLVIMGFMLATTAGFSQSAKKPLSDAALDKVTCAPFSKKRMHLVESYKFNRKSGVDPAVKPLSSGV